MEQFKIIVKLDFVEPVMNQLVMLNSNQMSVGCSSSLSAAKEKISRESHSLRGRASQ